MVYITEVNIVHTQFHALSSKTNAVASLIVGKQAHILHGNTKLLLLDTATLFA